MLALIWPLSQRRSAHGTHQRSWACPTVAVTRSWECSTWSRASLSYACLLVPWTVSLMRL
ncbi:hypothetical protein [Olsenella uli]